MMFSTTLHGAENIDFTQQDLGSEAMISPDPEKAHRVAVSYDWISKSKIDRRNFRHQHVNFSIAELAGEKIVYYNRDYKEGLSLGVTYSNVQFEWNRNPFFNRNNFDQISLTVSAFSERLCNWMWQSYVTMNWDMKYTNFTDYTNYNLLFWGRYECSPTFNLHTGFFAQTGMKIDRICPIVGFDWKISSKWMLNAVFPLNLSIVYAFDKHWSASLAGRLFDARYRVGKNERLKMGLFEYINRGVELACNYLNKTFSANVHAGSTFGGQFKISNKEHKKKKHFDLDAAAYVGGEVAIKF